MPKGSEPTTKFKVDISELKKGMQDAQRQIRMANAEFKAASSGMDDWTKSADGLGAKLTQLKSTLSAQESILSSLEQQYAAVCAEQGENSKGAQELAIKISNQQAAINNTEKAIGQYEQSLSQLNEAEKKAAKEGKSVEQALEEIKKGAEDAGKGAEKAEGGFTVLKGALASLLAEGIQAVIGGLKDLTTELLTDSSNAYAQFAAATGTATDAMGEYEEAIKNVYKNNFGESLEDVAEKMAKVKEVTGELDASNLQDMTEKAMTLEDTFDMDMTETLRGVNSLMDHFGMTSEEAFDLMSAGAQNGLNYTDELGDNVSEYAGKFAEAGFSADEYFQLLKNGAEGGAYNLDKVNDAVNEVTARLADGTIGDAINMYSDDTKALFEAWQNGDATQKEVMDSIVKDIQNTTNEQEKMNMAAKAFGTMAEDGGTQFIESLSSVGDAFTDVKGKAEELAAVKYDTPQAAFQGIARTLKVDLLQPIVDEVMPSINDLANSITDMMNGVEGAGERVGSSLSTILTTALSKITELMPQVATIGLSLISNLIQGILSALPQLTTTIIDVVNQLLLGLSTELPKVAQAIVEVVPQIIDSIVSMLPSFIDACITLVNAIVSALPQIIQALISALPTLIQSIVDGLLSGVNALTQGAITLLMAIVDALPQITTALVAALPDVINAIIKSLLGALPQLLQASITLFMAIVQAIPQIITVLAGAIPQIVDAIIDTLLDNIPLLLECAVTLLMAIVQAIPKIIVELAKAVPKIVTSIMEALGKLIPKLTTLNAQILAKVLEFFGKMIAKGAEKGGEFVSKLMDKVKELPSKLWEKFTDAVQKVVDFGGKLKEKAQEAGKKLVDGIKDKIEKLPDDIKSVGKNIVEGLWNGINDKFSWLTGKIKSFASDVTDKLKGFFGIHSPSRVMRDQVGKYLALGIAEGITKNKDSVSKAMEGIKADISSPLDLGLSGVKSNIMSGNPSGVFGNGSTNNNTSYTFNQYNNSPKALSRLDIYRQTKNQLNFAKGV